ncbi:MAG: GNAT family N-acetyltransferase [Sphingopyxis sp.]|uniref:GNAT family N-acetyltransferase n=1 Tax=Sphingopyxis sp. TaxID=1908224 RepID=UPI002AB9DA43|nr:GNAT family N-acetyltransferase [Sphingopyxis sp.]MDZ3830931.1 GNAT family N-acetyltransferase [Sphingopyxis sp.]
MNRVSIRTTNTPDAADRQVVLDQLRQFTRETVALLDNQQFAALVVDEAGTVIGGLIGSSRWGGFHIEMIALPAGLRGQGLGTQLLDLAESEARNRGCHHIYLDTHAFQARGFYERRGFALFGRIDGPAPFYPRLFLKKQLGGPADQALPLSTSGSAQPFT